MDEEIEKIMRWKCISGLSWHQYMAILKDLYKQGYGYLGIETLGRKDTLLHQRKCMPQPIIAIRITSQYKTLCTWTCVKANKNM